MTVLPTRLVAAACLAVILPMAVPARADDVADGIASAGALYAAGDLAGALKELSYAQSAVAGRLNEAFMATFPAAPSGWQADDAETQQSGFMGIGQSVERRYTKAAGGSVKLMAALDSPLMQTMGMLAGNPMMAASAGYSRARVSGREAMLKAEKAGGEVQLLMLVGGRLMITADGSGGATADDVKALVTAWDVDQLVKLGGL